MMKEFKLTSLDALAKHILTQSEKGAREAIKALPEGEWSYEMPLDGYERELTLKSKLTIKNGKITVDFSGSSPASLFGINSPPHLYPCLFRLRPQGGDRAACAQQHRLALLLRSHHRARHLRRSHPALARHRAPCDRPDAGRQRVRLPRAGAARHGAGGKRGPDLDPVALLRPWPRSAGADGKGQALRRHQHGARRHRRQARQGRAGHHRLPLGRRHHSGRGHRDPVPALFQAQALPGRLRRRRRMARAASRKRSRSPTARRRPSPSRPPPSTASSTLPRAATAAAPAAGAAAGRGSGAKLPDKGIHIIETGDCLVLELPGGGGFGNPDKRDRAALEADIAAGLVTPEAARRDYGYDG